MPHNGLKKIASGDLTMNDEPAGRNEIGRLSRHLQQNAAFTGDDSRDCLDRVRKRFIVAPAKFQLAMRTCHLAPKEQAAAIEQTAASMEQPHCDGETECG